MRRRLGTMIVYGYPRLDIQVDLNLAQKLNAEVVEVLPLWSALPDPVELRTKVADAGLTLHSAHGCWGGQSIQADRVDLASEQSHTWQQSLDDLKRCLDWLIAAGGSCLVIHPGGLSDEEKRPVRQDALIRGLWALSDHLAEHPTQVCVENMPPGVYPGSRMADLVEVVELVSRSSVKLALDTGHAHLSETVEQATRTAGSWLCTTHVHDNEARQDNHLLPGEGSIDWPAWRRELDGINYQGPIVLECIRRIRSQPDLITPEFLARLRHLTGLEES